MAIGELEKASDSSTVVLESFPVLKIPQQV